MAGAAAQVCWPAVEGLEAKEVIMGAAVQWAT